MEPVLKARAGERRGSSAHNPRSSSRPGPDAADGPAGLGADRNSCMATHESRRPSPTQDSPAPDSGRASFRSFSTTHKAPVRGSKRFTVFHPSTEAVCTAISRMILERRCGPRRWMYEDKQFGRNIMAITREGIPETRETANLIASDKVEGTPVYRSNMLPSRFQHRLWRG